MCKMIDQYADIIKGQFSFFDRMIINGYFRPLLSEQTRIGYLYSMGIPLRDFTEYFKDITDQLLKQIEDSAGELGRPVVYLPSSKDRKEDIAKGFLFQPLWMKASSVSRRHWNPAQPQNLLAGKGSIS